MPSSIVISILWKSKIRLKSLQKLTLYNGYVPGTRLSSSFYHSTSLLSNIHSEVGLKRRKVLSSSKVHFLSFPCVEGDGVTHRKHCFHSVSWEILQFVPELPTMLQARKLPKEDLRNCSQYHCFSNISEK